MRTFIEIVESATQETLIVATREARDEIVAEVGVDHLAGQCESVAADLAIKLDSMGEDSFLVYGVCDFPMVYDGKRQMQTPHCWVEVHGTILDPTRQQFDKTATGFVFEKGSPEFEDYVPHERISSRDLS